MRTQSAVLLVAIIRLHACTWYTSSGSIVYTAAVQTLQENTESSASECRVQTAVSFCFADDFTAHLPPDLRDCLLCLPCTTIYDIPGIAYES